MKQKLLLLIAVFFGIIAFMLTYQQIQQEKKKIRGSAVKSKLICLTRNMNAGDTITKEDIKEYTQTIIKGQKVSFRSIPWSQREQIIGRELDNFLAQGNILQYDDLKPASRRVFGLNAAVSTTMRAKAIAVDSISSINYLIRPNDRVDVIGTFRFPEMRGEKGRDTITLTVLQNVRVIATGNEWGKSISTRSKRRSYNTITLELSPMHVEIIEFASQKGRLTLSLRNNEDSERVNNLQSMYFSALEKYLEEEARKNQ